MNLHLLPLPKDVERLASTPQHLEAERALFFRHFDSSGRPTSMGGPPERPSWSR